MGWSPDAERHRNSASGDHLFAAVKLFAKWVHLICIEHHMSVVAVFLVVTDRFPRVKRFTVWGGHQMLKNTEIQHLVTTYLHKILIFWSQTAPTITQVRLHANAFLFHCNSRHAKHGT